MMQTDGAPEQWLDWLTGHDERKWKKATLILGGLTPEDNVPPSPLVAALSSSNSDIVFWSIIGLGRLGTHAKVAIPELIRIARSHERFGNRQAAIRALSRIASDETSVKEAVLRGLEDIDAFVRREALQALIAFSNLTAEELARIKTMEHDPDEDVARWSEITLRNIHLRGTEHANSTLKQDAPSARPLAPR